MPAFAAVTVAGAAGAMAVAVRMPLRALAQPLIAAFVPRQVTLVLAAVHASHSRVGRLEAFHGRAHRAQLLLTGMALLVLEPIIVHEPAPCSMVLFRGRLLDEEIGALCRIHLLVRSSS